MALTGKFSETPFADLVQFYATSKLTVAVTVTLPDSRGEDGVFYIEGGDVVDAWLGDAVGREAVRRALHLAEGSFRIEPDIHAAERTIPEPLPQILLGETARYDGRRRAERRATGSRLSTAAPPASYAPSGAGQAGDPAHRGALVASGLSPAPAPGCAMGASRAPARPRAARLSPRATVLLLAALGAALVAAAAIYFVRARHARAGARAAVRATDGLQVKDARPPFTTPCAIAVTIPWRVGDGSSRGRPDPPFM